jgi:hypothetical protein
VLETLFRGLDALRATVILPHIPHGVLCEPAAAEIAVAWKVALVYIRVGGMGTEAGIFFCRRTRREY